MRLPLLAASVAALLAAALPASVSAQGHVHTPGMQHPAEPAQAPVAATSEPGQAAFGAIAEVVRLLDADSTTDWSKVDVEALRQHLVDMDEVTMRAAVRMTEEPAGARFLVTGGSPRTVAAIRRMLTAHAPTLRAEAHFRVTLAEAPEGIDMTVLAATDADTRAAARIRGLGLAGLLTLGAHHAEHHVLIARGSAPHAHQH